MRQVIFTICHLKWCVYGACDVALPHCCRHWGVQRWWGAVEQQLPEVVVVGDGGDAVGLVAMMVVVEKESLCCLLIMCLRCGKCPQTSRDLPVSKSEGIPLPSLTGRGLCGVGHSVP